MAASTPKPGVALGSSDVVTTSYYYDALGRKTFEVDPDPDGAGALPSPGTSWSYDAAGNMTSSRATGSSSATTTQRMVETQHAYDVLGHQKEQRQLLYDGSWNITGAIVNAWGYDWAGNLTAAGTPKPGSAMWDTVTTSYYYDALGRKTAELSPRASGVAWSATSATDPVFGTVPTPYGDQPATYWSYNAAGQVATTRQGWGYGAGAVFQDFLYDALGRKTFQNEPHEAGQNHTLQSWTYDAVGNVLTAKDYDGLQTASTYDNLGRRLTETRPDGGVTSWAYDVLGNVLKAKSPAPGQTGTATVETTTTYDVLGRRLTETRPDLGVTSWGYDAAGDVMTIATPTPGDPASPAPGQVVTSYAYDALGGKSWELDPGVGNSKAWGYDAAGNVAAYVNASGNWQDYTYDAQGRKLSENQQHAGVTAPATIPVLTRWGYDGAGNVISVTTPAALVTGVWSAGTSSAIVTSFAFDGLGRKTDEWDPNQAGATGGPGNVAGSPRTRWGYDTRGNLTSRTDANTSVVNYGYDAMNRRTSESYAGVHYSDGTTEGTGDLPGGIYAWTYDSTTLRLTSEARGSTGAPQSTINYFYDSAGRVSLRQTLFSNTPVSNSVFQSYTYDLGARVMTESDTYSGSTDYTNGYAYDSMGRVTKIVQTSRLTATPIVKRVEYRYDRAGDVTLQERFDADGTGGTPVLRTSYTNDYAGHQLTEMLIKVAANPANNSVKATYTNAYETPTGSVLTIEKNITGDNVESVTWTYGYDGQDRLVSVTKNNQNHPSEQYTYDLNGNALTTKSGTAATKSLAYWLNNELLSDADYDYAYDAAGNVVEQKSHDWAGGGGNGLRDTHAWDGLGRLALSRRRLGTGHVGDGKVAYLGSYTYDGSDRRFMRVLTQNIVKQEMFVYGSGGDGDAVAIVFDKNGTNALDHTRYLGGVGGAGGVVLSQEDDGSEGAYRWLVQDYQGSTALLVDKAGAVQTKVRYDGRGAVVNEAGEKTRFGYAGRQYDEESGLQLHGARYYNGGNGRFASRDPVGVTGPDGANVYLYARDNYPNRVDVDGHGSVDFGVGGPIDNRVGRVNLGMGYHETFA